MLTFTATKTTARGSCPVVLVAVLVKRLVAALVDVPVEVMLTLVWNMVKSVIVQTPFVPMLSKLRRVTVRRHAPVTVSLSSLVFVIILQLSQPQRHVVADGGLVSISLRNQCLRQAPNQPPRKNRLGPRMDAFPKEQLVGR